MIFNILKVKKAILIFINIKMAKGLLVIPGVIN